MNKIQTGLSVKYYDVNANNKSFNLSNVNPQVDNAVLKEFAQKLTDLTTNTFSAAFRNTVEDITDAATAGVNIKLNSATPFFSLNSETFAAAIGTLASGTDSSMSFQAQINDAGGDEITGVEFLFTNNMLKQFGELGNANAQSFFNMISGLLINGDTPFVKFVVGANSLTVQPTIEVPSGGEFFFGISVISSEAAPFPKSIYDNADAATKEYFSNAAGGVYSLEASVTAE